MAWIYLITAGLLEVVWAFAMKQSDGFTRLWPTAVMAAAMAGSVGFLALAMRTLPSAPPTRSGPASARSARSWSASRCSARRRAPPGSSRPA